MRDTDFDIEVGDNLEALLGSKCLPYRYIGALDKILGLPITDDVEPKCSTVKALVLGDIQEIRVEDTNEYAILTRRVAEGKSTLPDITEHIIIHISTYSKENNVLKHEMEYNTNIERDWLYTYLNIMALIRVVGKQTDTLKSFL